MTDLGVESVTGPDVRGDAPSAAAVAASLRRLRIWVIALTVVVAIVAVAVVGVLAVAAMYAVGAGSAGSGPRIGDEEIARTTQEIRLAYGDRLRNLEVRAVNVEFGGAPFPFSLVDAGDGDAMYVTYTLRGSPVVVADLVGGMLGADLSASGIVPLNGSLTSRMTQAQLDRLLAVYAAETASPLGSVRRYGDMPYDMGNVQARPERVAVGTKSYPAEELWSATEGRIVEGDTVHMDEMMEPTRTAYIFREDPRTGALTFLGTEPAMAVW